MFQGKGGEGKADQTQEGTGLGDLSRILTPPPEQPSINTVLIGSVPAILWQRYKCGQRPLGVCYVTWVRRNSLTLNCMIATSFPKRVQVIQCKQVNLPVPALLGLGCLVNMYIWNLFLKLIQ